MNVETAMFWKGLFVGLVLGVGAVLAYLRYKVKMERQKKQIKIVKSVTAANMNSDGLDEVFIWLNDVLLSYKKEYMAYMLEMFRLRNHLRDEQVKGLQQAYGKSLDEAPSLRLHQKYVKRFSNWTKLTQAEKKWLQQKNITVDDENQMAGKIEKILIEEVSKESPEIFEDYCRQNSIVLECK
ncbi:hypothetical protein IKQ19_03510 [Candidatus Saccharibacteria bacterium]|nr:hypothetical protein [Candidatus Saccharibacteria bacterium]